MTDREDRIEEEHHEIAGGRIAAAARERSAGDEPASYTLTAADADGCRQILADLAEMEADLGGFRVGYVNGARKSATATVHFDKAAGPFSTAAAVTRAVECLPTVALLAKKIVAHYDTHLAAGAEA